MAVDVNNSELIDIVESFGGNHRNLIILEGKKGGDDERTFEYQDLLRTDISGSVSNRVDIAGVIEEDNKPFIYLTRNAVGYTAIDYQEKITRLCRLLACRGYASYLAVVDVGRMTVYPCTFQSPADYSVSIDAQDLGASTFIQDFGQGLLTSANVRHNPLQLQQDNIHRLLVGMLEHVTDEMISSNYFKDKCNKHIEVLALVGRTLFTRFLLDRNLIRPDTFSELYQSTDYSPERAFDTPSSAALVCAWQDKVFNGELLPLLDRPGNEKQAIALEEEYLGYFQALINSDGRALHPLGAIMCHADKEGQLPLWGFVDFAHVPVGLLSEVYEDYAHKYFKDEAKVTSVYYTPRHIAEILVNQAFSAIDSSKRHLINILDPAAGAGVFLVLCLRQLVREYWRATGTAPDTIKIRQILYNQIQGFDINPHALSLATLSLYLTAIELDPEPLPPSKLRFGKKLIGSVLLNVRDTSGPILGSLGDVIGPEYNGKYDLIIGNPPWSSHKSASHIDEAANCIANRVIKARGLNNRDSMSAGDSGAIYINPDKVPDLAFVWKSMEWARPKGIIALALHGRLLFKTTDAATESRKLLFQCLRITGILNCVALAGHKILWPNVNAPYCLMFAQNEKPAPNDLFYFLSPQPDRFLNQRAKIRIDPYQAQVVQFHALEQEPCLLKVLSRGNSLDVALVRRLHKLAIEDRGTSIGNFWAHNNLRKGEGYRRLKKEEGRNKVSAKSLLELNGKNLTVHDRASYFIQTSTLTDFTFTHVDKTGDPEQYHSPLVLFNQVPGQNRHEPRARISLQRTPIVYNKSFFGFSTRCYKEPEKLAKYLFLVGNSNLYIYYLLMTCGEFGVERRATYLHSIERFPIISLSKFTDEQVNDMDKILLAIKQSVSMPYELLDSWVYQLYGLNDSEIQVINDAIETNLPYKRNVIRGQLSVKQTEIVKFCEVLNSVLSGLFKLAHGEIVILPVPTKEGLPFGWRFIDIKVKERVYEALIDHTLHDLFAKLADEEGCSQVFFNMAPGWIRLGMLAQYRYWTISRARLCAHDIVEAWDKSSKMWGRI